MSRRPRTKKPATDPALRANSAPEIQVSFRLQRLESHVAFAQGGLALWIAIFFNPPGFTAQLVALLGVALGGWARAYPARQPQVMALRALILTAAGALLMGLPGSGGPTGPAVAWALGTTLAYSLLLPLVWGVPVLLATVGGYLLACLLPERPPAWQAAGAWFGVLAILGALFLAIGRSLRASELRAEQSRLDERSNLYNEAGFFTNGGELFAASRRKGEPFTMALLRAADLRDANELLGRRTANKLFEQTVKGIAAATPPGGIAARTDTVEFAVVMPGMTMDRAEALLHQRLGRPPQVKVTASGNTAVILLDVMVVQAPPEVHALEDLYDRVRQRQRERSGDTAITQATDHGGMSTLQGFLMHDPPVPQSQKPTLPMPLSREPGPAPGRRPPA